MLIGLFIHGIFFSHWLPEGFSASNTGMRFTLWFHSGVLVGLALLLQTIHTPYKLSTCRIVGSILALWGLGLIGLRPNPEYYRLQAADIMVITRLYIPITIMLLCGIILFIISFSHREDSSASDNNRYQNINPLTVFFAFTLGISGFFAIPITNLLKSAALTLMNGRTLFSDSFLNSELLFNLFSPAASYPWFLFIVNFGFILWIFSMTKNWQVKPGNHIPYWPLLLLLASALNFVQSNFIQSKKLINYGVICCSRASGEILWQSTGLTAAPVTQTRLNSPATPTVAIDDERVYAWFGSAGLVCFNFEGDKLWQKLDIPFEGIHGVAASPVIAENKLIIQSAMSTAPMIIALQATTGIEIWRLPLQAWDGLHGEHRTPVVATLRDSLFLVDWGGGFRPELNLIDVENGAIRSSYHTNWDFSGNVYITSPIVAGNMIYLAGKNQISALNTEKILDKIDNCVIWQTSMKSKGANTATPIVWNDKIVVVSDNGWVSNIEAATGKIQHQRRLVYGKYFSSVISGAGNIYISNTRGITSIILPNAELELIAENALEEGIFATPALIDDELYIRTAGHLWRIENKDIQETKNGTGNRTKIPVKE